MQNTYLLVIRSQWFGFRVVFLQSILQNFEIVVVSPHQWSFTIRADRALGKIPRRHTRNKTATAALQSSGDALADRFLGNLKPDREIKWGVMASENRCQALGLWNRARKSIEDKTMRTMQSQPIFDQFYNCRIRHEDAPLNGLVSYDPQ